MEVVTCTWASLITALFIGCLLIVFGFVVLSPFILVMWFGAVFILKLIFKLIDYLETLWYNILKKFSKES